MSEFLTTLQERRAAAWERAKAIMDAAADEKRDLTAEENENLTAIDTDLNALDARIKETQERYARAEAADAIRAQVSPILRASRQPDTETSVVRAVLRDGFADAFPGMEHRALVSASNAVVPTSFYDRLIKVQLTLNPTYGLATVIRTSGGENITVPRLTADAAATAYIPEGTAITAADPTLSSVTLGAYGIKGLTLWSRELGQDAALNVDDIVAFSLGRDIGLKAGSAFTLGTGTGQPHGIIDAATAGATATGTPFFTPDDLIGLVFKVAAPYRANGKWLMANSAISKVRQFKDTAGNYLYAVNVGQPDTFMGFPVYENPHMAAVASATKSVLFGDIAAGFFVREVSPLRVEKSDDAYFANDQTALKAVWRVDSKLVDVGSVRTLVSNNT